MPDALFVYRYLGDTEKVFHGARRAEGEEQLVKPGSTVESGEPLHHGHLEPLSESAMKYAEDNELALERDAGELWKRGAAPKKRAAPKTKVAPKKRAPVTDETPAPETPKEA